MSQETVEWLNRVTLIGFTEYLCHPWWQLMPDDHVCQPRALRPELINGRYFTEARIIVSAFHDADVATKDAYLSAITDTCPIDPQGVVTMPTYDDYYCESPMPDGYSFTMDDLQEDMSAGDYDPEEMAATLRLVGERDVYDRAARLERENGDMREANEQLSKTLAKLQAECRHSWVAGMMIVHDEDVAEIARTRHVECEKCERVYRPGD